MRDHPHEVKAVSFLAHRDHGFKQAPLEKNTAAEYESAARIQTVDFSGIGTDDEFETQECEGAHCLTK